MQDTLQTNLYSIVSSGSLGDEEEYIDTRREMRLMKASWSSGMIFGSGPKGRGFNSR